MEGLTLNVKDIVSDKLESDFLEFDFIKTKFPDIEDFDIDFDEITNDAGAIVQRALLVIRPSDTTVFANISPRYEFYKEAANFWAHKYYLHVPEIAIDEENNEVTFVFEIDSPLAIAKKDLNDITDLLTVIKARIASIEKYAPRIIAETPALVELESVYTKLINIESKLKESSEVVVTADVFLPNKGEKFWAILKDRNGKVLDRTEVSFKDAEYAKSVFNASKIKVRPSDVVEFE
jgi:hypothetical protein